MKKQSFTELREICATTRKWGKPTHELCGPILICWNQPWNVETMVLKLSQKGEIQNTEVHELQDSVVYIY